MVSIKISRFWRYLPHYWLHNKVIKTTFVSMINRNIFGFFNFFLGRTGKKLEILSRKSLAEFGKFFFSHNQKKVLSNFDFIHYLNFSNRLGDMGEKRIESGLFLVQNSIYWFLLRFDEFLWGEEFSKTRLVYRFQSKPLNLFFYLNGSQFNQSL